MRCLNKIQNKKHANSLLDDSKVSKEKSVLNFVHGSELEEHHYKYLESMKTIKK